MGGEREARGLHPVAGERNWRIAVVWVEMEPIDQTFSVKYGFGAIKICKTMEILTIRVGVELPKFQSRERSTTIPPDPDEPDCHLAGSEHADLYGNGHRAASHMGD